MIKSYVLDPIFLAHFKSGQKYPPNQKSKIFEKSFRIAKRNLRLLERNSGPSPRVEKPL
jgi:hypothetical protein